MADHIRPMTASDLGVVARVLTAAFEDDPFFGVLLGGERQRSLRHRLAYAAFFRKSLRGIADSGGRIDVAHDGPEVVGAAAWMPPSSAGSPPSRGLGWPIGAQRDALLIRFLYPSASAQIDQGFTELRELHPKPAHWYLAFVGVAPANHGRGFGHALLQPVLIEADAAGIPSYLETPFEQTLPFYESLGFRVERRVALTFRATSIWTMFRAAVGSDIARGP